MCPWVYLAGSDRVVVGLVRVRVPVCVFCRAVSYYGGGACFCCVSVGILRVGTNGVCFVCSGLVCACYLVFSSV